MHGWPDTAAMREHAELYGEVSPSDVAELCDVIDSLRATVDRVRTLAENLVDDDGCVGAGQVLRALGGEA